MTLFPPPCHVFVLSPITCNRCQTPCCNWTVGSPLPLIILLNASENSNRLWYENFDTMSPRCVLCDRSFDSEEALQQHLRDSPTHALAFDCKTCNRSFGNEEALDQHLRDSRIYQQDTETPLNVFSRSFLAFDFNPSLLPATPYASLQRQEEGSKIYSSRNLCKGAERIPGQSSVSKL